jgi:hypothetical protein
VSRLNVLEVLSNLRGYAPARVESDRGKPGGRGALAVLLACVLVGATFAGGVAATSAAGSATTAPTPPSGMVGVASDQIEDIRPSGIEATVSESDVEGAVYVSDHAATTEVSIVTRGQAKQVGAGASPSDVAGEAVCSSPAAGKTPVFDCSASSAFSLVVSDDTVHDGRTVAVRVDVLKDALGYVPESLAVQNSETGEVWQSAATVEDGYLVADLEHFSSNAVEFSGTARVTADPATSGSEFQYQLSNLDAVENAPVVNLTGTVNSEYDNESASGVGVSHTDSLSVGGNLPPTDGEGGNPVLKVTGHVSESTYNPYTDEGDGVSDGTSMVVGDGPNDGVTKTEIRIQPTFTGEISQLTLPVTSTSGSDYGATVDIYIVQEGIDTTYGEGTLVKSNWDPAWQTGNQTITLDTAYPVTAGTDYTVEFVTSSTDSDSIEDSLELNQDDQPDSDWFSLNGGPTRQYASLYVTSKSEVNSLSVSDGSGHSHTFGDFNDSETKTTTLDLDLSSSELNFDGSGTGSIDYSLTMQEHTETVDPGVELNGHSVTHQGTLAEGETATLTLNESWVREGVNRLNVSVGDGSLSSDAPTPAVGLNYSHGAVDDVMVDYQGETWSERYNITRSWGSATEDATLTVPFSGNVVSVRDVETRVNGGSWSDVGPSSYSLDGTTLTVEFGDLPDNSTTDVRVNGSKVQAINGTVNVLEPTTEANDLRTRFEVASTSGEFALDVSGTASSEWLHYLTNESWTDPAEYALVESDGQTLVLPNAGDGARATARTLPLQVRPQTDVRVSVEEAGESPVLDVAPGAVSGDSVEYGWFNAKTGAKYALTSISANGTARDKADATDGTVWLTDPEDDDETLRIEVLESGGSSTPGSEPGRSVGILENAQNVAPSVHPVVLLVAGSVALLGGAFVVRRTRLKVWTVYPVIGLVAVVVLESLQPGSVTGVAQEIALQFGAQASDVAPALLMGGGGLALWGVYRLIKKFTSEPPVVIERK